MIAKTTENQNLRFFEKYKKWILTLVGIQIIPTILLIGGFISFTIYNHVTNELRNHPYKKHLHWGYDAGLKDGMKDRKVLLGDPFFRKTSSYLKNTPWSKYSKETSILENQYIKEKDEYLAQFPPEERGEKLLEIKINDIKMPAEKLLAKRFKKRVDFYTDYVAKQVKREDYKTQEKYEEALQTTAWKAGYEYGYASGRYRDEKPGTF